MTWSYRQNEVLEDIASTAVRPFCVSGSLAGKHERAADVREGLETRGLTARCRGHRFVEASQPVVDLP